MDSSELKQLLHGSRPGQNHLDLLRHIYRYVHSEKPFKIQYGFSKRQLQWISQSVPMSTGRTPAAMRKANLYQLHWVTVSVATTCRRSVSLWMSLYKCGWESKILINKTVGKNQNCSYNNQISLRAIRYSIHSFIPFIYFITSLYEAAHLSCLSELFCLLLAVSLYLCLPWTNLQIINIYFSTTLNIGSIINCSPSSLTIRLPGFVLSLSLCPQMVKEAIKKLTPVPSCIPWTWNILTHKLVPLRETVAQWPLPWSNSMVQSGRVPRRLKNN